MFDNFLDKLKNDKIITLETTPPHSARFEVVVEKIKEFGLDSRVDGFSATDSPLSKLKYSALFAAMRLQNEFKKPAIATMSMRDRNKIALQADLLGANEVDVRAILALTGDPIHLSDQKESKGVFEGNSTLLQDIINSFNSGVDFSGKEFKDKPKTIYPFSVLNSYAKNPKNLLKKMITKLEHNTTAIITQPVYSVDSAKMLLEFLKEAKETTNKDAQIILGFFPITKYKTAKFLVEKLPGVYVPDEWVEVLERASKEGSEREYEVGFEKSLETLKEIFSLHPKIHMMSANNFELADDLIKNLR